MAGVLTALRRGAVSGGEELVARWEADDQLTAAAPLRYISTAKLGLSKASGVPQCIMGQRVWRGGREVELQLAGGWWQQQPINRKPRQQRGICFLPVKAAAVSCCEERHVFD